MGRLECEVVCVYLDHTRDQWPSMSTLHNPEITELGGVGFISGTLVSTDENHWTHGRRCHFCLSKVASMVEFATFEDFSAWTQHYRSQGE